MNVYESMLKGLQESVELSKKCKEMEKEIVELEAQLPKEGVWIHGREIGKEWNCEYWVTYYEDWQCSNCGVVFEQESKPKYHYCPNCGAKMDGEEKDDADN